MNEKYVFSRKPSERERRCAKWVHYPTHVIKTTPHTHTHTHTHKHWSVNMYQGRNTANTELHTTDKHRGNTPKVCKKECGDWVDNY